MDRAEVFKAQAREVALFHARRKAFAAGRGFILRQVTTPAAEFTLEQAAHMFARATPPDYLKGAFVETQAFDAVSPDDAGRWWTTTLADLAPRTDARDHFESAKTVENAFRTCEEDEDEGMLDWQKISGIAGRR